MPILPKTHFKWREPKALLQIRDAEERARLRWWHRPMLVLITALLMMGSWYVARFNPQKHPPPFHIAILMDVGIGILFAYLMPWVISLCPSHVKMSETHLVRSRGNNHLSIKYSDIEHFAWRTAQGMTTLLIKKRRAKRDIQIGLAAEISREAVYLFLLSRGVMLQPGEKW